jgi:hypothetical protein
MLPERDKKKYSRRNRKQKDPKEDIGKFIVQIQILDDLCSGCTIVGANELRVLQSAQMLR